MNVQDLLKKFEAKPIRGLADSDRRGSQVTLPPNGVTVTLSDEERQYLMSLLVASETRKQSDKSSGH